jgi:type I restriction-modification system DNA methylase subunit
LNKNVGNNTHQNQENEHSNKLWAIANDLRGNMDTSKFKNYILGIIFYRYFSERTESYIDDLMPLAVVMNEMFLMAGNNE